MLGKIWQWLKNLFQSVLSLFGFRKKSTSSWLAGEDSTENTETAAMSDTDHEFLFNQVLEGVANGWHEGEIVKYFDRLGERGKPKNWVAWLERFGDKVLSSPAPNQQLAMLMVRFGEVSQTIPQIGQIGEASYQIGRQLLTRNNESDIWEYDGPDADSLVPEPASAEAEAPSTTTLPTESTASEMEMLSLEDLIPPLEDALAPPANEGESGAVTEERQPPATPVGITELEPEDLGNESTATPAAVSQPTAQEWFYQGLQQADGGDFIGAIASWDQALALKPNLITAWHNRGSALGYLGQYEEAIASFDRALELKPNDYQAWHNRGCACQELGQLEEALASYNKALEIKPDFAPAQSRCNQLLGNNEQENEQNS